MIQLVAVWASACRISIGMGCHLDQPASMA